MFTSWLCCLCKFLSLLILSETQKVPRSGHEKLLGSVYASPHGFVVLNTLVVILNKSQNVFAVTVRS